MKLVKISNDAKSVAERWESQYKKNGVWNISANGLRDKEDVYVRLTALTDSVDLDFVDEIIGNKSWTNQSCCECGVYNRDDLVSFDVNAGEYDFYLCLGCINKARDLIKSNK